MIPPSPRSRTSANANRGTGIHPPHGQTHNQNQTRSNSQTHSISLEQQKQPKAKDVKTPLYTSRRIHVPRNLSSLSSQTVPDSLWFGADIQLGAGVVIIQPDTERMVVLSEKYTESVRTGRKVPKKVPAPVEDEDREREDRHQVWERNGPERKGGKSTTGKRLGFAERWDVRPSDGINLNASGSAEQTQRRTTTSIPSPTGVIRNGTGWLPSGSNSKSSPTSRTQYVQPRPGTFTTSEAQGLPDRGRSSPAASITRGFSDLSSRAGTWISPTSSPNPNQSPSLSGPAPAWSDGGYHDGREAGQRRRRSAALSPPMPAVELEDEYVDIQCERWFLPKGRKDVGESLEDAAIREGYEESGYRITLYPLYIPTHAALPPTPTQASTTMTSAPPALPKYTKPSSTRSTEPIYVSTHHMPPNHRTLRSNGLEYLTFYYIAYLPPDAVREEGTGMEDEVDYVSHLMGFEDAFKRLGGEQGNVARVAVGIWKESMRREREEGMRKLQREREGERSGRGMLLD